MVRKTKMTTNVENDMDYDWRIYMQTDAWQRRFKALTPESPQSEWNWIVGHYVGDQDELDHLFNEYNKHGEEA